MQATHLIYSNLPFRGVRFMLSLLLAAIVTVLLILLMHSLIAMEVVDVPVSEYKPADIFLQEDREIKEFKEEKIPRPVDPDPIPDTPPMPESTTDNPEIKIAILPPSMSKKLAIRGPDSGAAIPIFRVAPEYPRRAVTKGIEGFVDLMFDISATGKTENIRIIYAEPSGYFERASTKTLAKWKFNPAMEDGVARAQKNQTTRIVFELEK